MDVVLGNGYLSFLGKPLVIGDFSYANFLLFSVHGHHCRHWIDAARSVRLKTGSIEGRRHVAQPLPYSPMLGPGDPY